MIDLNKAGNPANIYGKDVFSTFSLNLPKEVNVFLRHVETKSDEGFKTC
jgi:hypothetical protein